jgi:transposase-like protein
VKRRGLAIAPEIAVGDGALGFWKALDEVWPGTRHQSCWVHKTANVLNKAPNSVQLAMKADLREVHSAPDRATAEKAISVFAEKYGAKYAKGVECLTKDRQTLLAFFDFPAEQGSPADLEPDRERVRHRAPQDRAHPWLAVAGVRFRDGTEVTDHAETRAA